jgi:hypothetical protein
VPVLDANGAAIGMVSLNDLAIECVEPDTKMKNGPTKIAHTLAAVCRRRSAKQKAA